MVKMHLGINEFDQYCASLVCMYCPQPWMALIHQTLTSPSQLLNISDNFVRSKVYKGCTPLLIQSLKVLFLSVLEIQSIDRGNTLTSIKYTDAVSEWGIDKVRNREVSHSLLYTT